MQLLYKGAKLNACLGNRLSVRITVLLAKLNSKEENVKSRITFAKLPRRKADLPSL
jgi:hypothetical protein